MVAAHHESELSGAFRHAAIGMAIVDPGGRYRKVNLALCRMLGYTEAEFLALTFKEITHPDDLDDQGNLHRLLKGDIESFQMEKRYRHRDGHFVRGLVSVSVARDEAGAPLHQLALIQDLSGDNERRTTETRYRTLFEHAPDGILIGDPQSNYLDANPSVCRMLGYKREELIGLNATDIIDATEAPRISPVIEDIKARVHHHQEWLFKRKDGSTFPVEVIATLMPDGNLLGMVRDITDRKATGVALRASLDEKQALLKEVHHRVKNNMQVITSLLRLEANRIDHETTRAVLKQMQNRIQSMAVLHETLYRSGNFTGVDLGSYLKLVSGQLVRSLALFPGQVELHLDLASKSVDLDQAIPCGLIVNELVSNAFKHAFPKGRRGEVWIDLQRKGDAALILRVRDNGVGLPDDLEGAREKSLGLQLVSDLTRQLRGHLVIGPGSSFEVTFGSEHKAP